MLNSYPNRTAEIGTGEQAVHNTLLHMRKLILDGAKNWEVRYAAAQLVKDIPERNDIKEVNTVFKYIQHYARYTKDPWGVELLHSPEVSLRLIREDGFASLDCDDYTILGLALVKVLGYNVALKVVSTQPNRKFHHVYGLVNIQGRWWPFDAIRREKPLGWESDKITRQGTMKI